MWCMSLLTFGIKPDVGNPMLHHPVGLIIPQAESTAAAGVFPGERTPSFLAWHEPKVMTTVL